VKIPVVRKLPNVGVNLDCRSKKDTWRADIASASLMLKGCEGLGCEDTRSYEA
jgi:hypothetical protein